MKIISIIAIVVVALLGFGIYNGSINLHITSKGTEQIKDARGKAAQWIRNTGEKASDAARGK